MFWSEETCQLLFKKYFLAYKTCIPVIRFGERVMEWTKLPEIAPRQPSFPLPSDIPLVK